MNSAELQTFVETQLLKAKNPEAAIRAKGSVVHSGLNTLCPRGRFYLVGHNPGGPEDTGSSILDSIINNPGADGKTLWSAYTANCWKRHKPGQICTCFEGGREGRLRVRVSHQRRVIELCALLHGVKTHDGNDAAKDTATEMTFSTNAIFSRTPDVVSLGGAADWWKICWPVHQMFLSVVRPEWIIALGRDRMKSAFALFSREVVGPIEIVDVPECGDTNGRFLKGSLPLKGRNEELFPVKIMCVPHPSGRRGWINDRFKDWIITNVATVDGPDATNSSNPPPSTV